MSTKITKKAVERILLQYISCFSCLSWTILLVGSLSEISLALDAFKPDPVFLLYRCVKCYVWPISIHDRFGLFMQDAG